MIRPAGIATSSTTPRRIDPILTAIATRTQRRRTQSTDDIKITTAAQAARALAPIVGRFDTVLFAVGLIGAGLISVPVLAGSAAYPPAELFNWREGLDYPLRRAPGFYTVIYTVIAAAAIVGISGNFLGVDPVKGLVYAAVLQGFLAPLLIVLLTVISSEANVMGRRRNGWYLPTRRALRGAGVVSHLRPTQQCPLSRPSASRAHHAPARSCRSALEAAQCGAQGRSCTHTRRTIMGTVARVTEISATSEKSFQDAIAVGIARANDTLRRVQAAWVKEQEVRVADGKITEYQVNMLVTFVLDD
jgi:flavin-binding protein dodecin